MSTNDTPAEARDLKLKVCLGSFQGFGELPPLKTEALHSVGVAYERNIRSVYALLMFPLAAITTAIITQDVVTQTQSEMPGAGHDDVARVVTGKLDNYHKRRLAIFEQGGDQAKRLMEVETNNAFAMLRPAAQMVEEGAEAWMAAQITGTWTAFEAMAEELWETALNTKPKWLAGLSGEDRLNRRGRRQKQPGSHDVPTRRQGDEDKKVDLDWLQRHEYDLSKCMGTVHKRRYKFDTLVGIRRAFAEAFSKDHSAIDAILSDKALDALSLTRNNFLHSGGIIDKEIVQRTADLPSALHGTLGQRILLDGELVAALVGPVMKCGQDLVVAVDDWLASH